MFVNKLPKNNLLPVQKINSIRIAKKQQGKFTLTTLFRQPDDDAFFPGPRVGMAQKAQGKNNIEKGQGKPKE